MRVLGICGGVEMGTQDGAAALVIEGRLVAAAEEERFVGIKFANGHLPRNAIAYCLAHAGLGMRDIDTIVYPGATYADIRDTLRRYITAHFGCCPKLVLVDHHEAHAASTYFASGWDDALVVTMDNSGDGKSTTVWEGRGGELRHLETYTRPNSLGLFFSSITQYLGFQRDSDEYKVMGMAAYGSAKIEMDHILEVTDSGYSFHCEFLTGLREGRQQPPKQAILFDNFPLPLPARTTNEPLEAFHFDVAASAQHQLERAVCRLVETHLASRSSGRICLAGGVALNCLMNQKIRELPCVDSVFVPPFCSDAGLAVGAAYLESLQDGDRIAPLEHAYWGPAFTPDEIRTVLQRTAVRYRELTDPAATAVELLGQDRIIGWFQDRMEFGPRALGNRSILVNAKHPNAKDLINSKVKFREEFRPLAPAVIHDSAAAHFVDYVDSPYMTQTFNVTEATRRLIPSAVHADGTARIQSVHPSHNHKFHELLVEADRQLGLPMVINTSLNAYNDPIACLPHQALRTLYATGLDALILGPFLIEKER